MKVHEYVFLRSPRAFERIECFFASEHKGHPLAVLLDLLGKESVWSTDFSVNGEFSSTEGESRLLISHSTFPPGRKLIIPDTITTVEQVESAVRTFCIDSAKQEDMHARVALEQAGRLRRLESEIVISKAKAAVTTAFPAVTELNYATRYGEFHAFVSGNDLGADPAYVVREVHGRFTSVIKLKNGKSEWDSCHEKLDCGGRPYLFFVQLARQYAVRELSVDESALELIGMIGEERPVEVYFFNTEVDRYEIKAVVFDRLDRHVRNHVTITFKDNVPIAVSEKPVTA